MRASPFELPEASDVRRIPSTNARKLTTVTGIRLGEFLARSSIPYFIISRWQLGQLFHRNKPPHFPKSKVSFKERDGAPCVRRLPKKQKRAVSTTTSTSNRSRRAASAVLSNVCCQCNKISLFFYWETRGNIGTQTVLYHIKLC